MVLVAALLVACAVFIAVSATMPAPAPWMARRLGRTPSRVVSQDERTDVPFQLRVTQPLAAWLRRAATRSLPGRAMEDVERRIRRADVVITPQTFVLWQGGMAVMGAVLVAAAATMGGMAGMALGVVAVALGALPLLWLRSRAQARQTAVLRALPDALDLIVTVVEAGQSIDTALTEVARETHGPLGRELRRAMREVTLGSSRREALLRLVERMPVADLKSVVHSILQAQESGIPLGGVLRSQAEQMRTRRRQRAEAQAGRAPVKMVVVLVLLVMPAMILFMMGPAAIRFAQQLD